MDPVTSLQACVLVVDDEPLVLKALSRQVRALGCEVVGTESPETALSLLAGNCFDLLVSDLHLPLPSGRVFVVEAAAVAPSVPRIVVTGDNSLRGVMGELGTTAVDGVLPKPYDWTLLSDAIRRALETRRSPRSAELDTRRLADGLVRALALRDVETENHSRRVSAWARRLADEMGIPSGEAVQIELGALLHDVGKIGVPDAILRKPGPLTEQEWVEMRRHPSYGRDMLAGIPLLAGAAQVVYSHHERFEGRGYPHGLSGAAIPIGARIFAVVDTYDAMTSDRVYRKATTDAAARAEIGSLPGTQFDPDVVQAFLRVPIVEWLAIRQRFDDVAPAI